MSGGAWLIVVALLGVAVVATVGWLFGTLAFATALLVGLGIAFLLPLLDALAGLLLIGPRGGDRRRAMGRLLLILGLAATVCGLSAFARQAIADSGQPPAGPVLQVSLLQQEWMVERQMGLTLLGSAAGGLVVLMVGAALRR